MKEKKHSTSLQKKEIKIKEILFILLFSLILVNLTFIYLFYKNFSPIVRSHQEEKKEIASCTPYNIEITSIDSDKAEISWWTKEKCFSLVQYGLDKKNLNLTDIPSVKKNYEYKVILEPLEINTTYYFIIISDNSDYGFDSMPIEFKHQL